MGTGSRRRFYPAVALLLSTTVLSPQRAQAQAVEPYVWASCAHLSDPGCSNGYGDSPQACCNSDTSLYSGSTVVSVEPGVKPNGEPAWICTLQWHFGNITIYILANCPSGLGIRQYYSRKRMQQFGAKEPGQRLCGETDGGRSGQRLLGQQIRAKRRLPHGRHECAGIRAVL